MLSEDESPGCDEEQEEEHDGAGEREDANGEQLDGDTFRALGRHPVEVSVSFDGARLVVDDSGSDGSESEDGSEHDFLLGWGGFLFYSLHAVCERSQADATENGCIPEKVLPGYTHFSEMVGVQCLHVAACGCESVSSVAEV